MDWDDMRHFLALARLGSIRAAGTSLGVSHSTVLRRVEALEIQLGVRLFDRHRDGFLLTDVARRLLPAAERIERDISGIERDIVGSDERLAGSVAITCCDSYVSDLLLAELAALCARHPDIELSVTTDSRTFDLAKREADVAIRTLAIGAVPPEQLIGKRLAPVMVAGYVARGYEQRLDPERGARDSRWVAFEGRDYFASIVARSKYPDLPIWGEFSSLNLLVQAASHGLGLVMLPTYVGDRSPALRRLDGAAYHAADLWMLTHPDLRGNARVRAARSTIAESFEANCALFAGAAVSEVGHRATGETQEPE